MKTDEFEWLYLQWLDGQISDRQRSQLSEMLSGNHLYQKEADQFTTSDHPPFEKPEKRN